MQWTLFQCSEDQKWALSGVIHGNIHVIVLSCTFTEKRVCFHVISLFSAHFWSHWKRVHYTDTIPRTYLSQDNHHLDIAVIMESGDVVHERSAWIPGNTHKTSSQGMLVPRYSIFIATSALTHYPLMATIVAIWPNWGLLGVFCRIGKFNTCTLTTLILKNLFPILEPIRCFRDHV